ncbi:unnamed protein product [Porites evermanni]|uniref:Protein kinase domain-containing protein n=1 Tax=Porites evermanni TaxID=104178 RepID=A0ABN8S808_9CNID|nr:unnamed protein product [Porites evermanni]
MVQLDCDPLLEQAIQSGDFRNLFWKVNDLRNKSEFVLAYCNESLICIGNDHLGNFEKRIKMRKYPVNGVLNVEQLIKDDFLTFTCLVQRKDLVVYQQVHRINSSLTCDLPTVHSQLNLIFTYDDLFTTSPLRNVEYTWSVTTVPPKDVPFYSSLMQKLTLVALNAPAFSHVIVSYNLVLSPPMNQTLVSATLVVEPELSLHVKLPPPFFGCCCLRIKLNNESKKKKEKKNQSRSSSENFLTEIREENPAQNIETEPSMALEENLGETDFQLAILQDYGEEESAKLQEQLRGKREQVAELERELNDREQDYIKLQTDLCETKEKLNKCKSLLTTREWLISREEIEIMREKSLGEGSYGKVFKGRYRGLVVAVKELKCLSTSQERDLFEREMDIASRCRHPCLLQFIGATQDEKMPLFVTELMESSLRKLLEKRQLSDKEIAVISLDVAHALNYLHQRKPKAIVHRDVSSVNVLLWKQNGEWRGKLGDYGTAKFLQEIMTKSPGAMIYGAPEVGCPHNQTVKVSFLVVS